VFPCRDKKPLTNSGFKDASNDLSKVIGWWTQYPDAQVGVPVGKNTGTIVLDVDMPDGPNTLRELEEIFEPLPATTKVQTKSGGLHIWFALPNGVIIKNSAGKLGPGLDIRGEGGYVIAPPSEGYKWLTKGAGFATIPAWLLDLITEHSADRPTSTAPPTLGASTTAYGRTALAQECAAVALAPVGARNDALNVSACKIGGLVAGGQIDHSEAESNLLHAALRAGLTESESIKTIASGFKAGTPRAPETVNNVNMGPFSSTTSTSGAASTTSTSVNNSSTRDEKPSTSIPATISQLVDDYIEESSGMFTLQELCQYLDLNTRELRQAAAQALKRRTKNKTIEKAGSRNGGYRKIEREVVEMDIQAPLSGDGLNITLPFGLHDLVKILPGNIVLVAGEQNAGKTAFLLNLIRMNMHKSEVHYFNSESSQDELNLRLSNFPQPRDSWKFRAYERSSEFNDVVVPGHGKINVIDFLEIHDEFWRVGGLLKKIHNALEGAVAVIALQKNKGTDVGRGGTHSLELPRLYIAMAPNRVKIVKGKIWKDHRRSPNNLEKTWKLSAGCLFSNESEWYLPEDGED